METHTILGAGGAIGTELAKTLSEYNKSVRLVSRNPKKVNGDDEVFSADLCDAQAVNKAVEGSEVVYLTVGLPYQYKLWEQKWPLIMQNVIDACKRHKAVLIFFDNIYMYGKVDGPITEQSPIKPSSKKGMLRAKIANMLTNAWQNGEIKGAIARSADFYGPGSENSMFNLMVLKNFRSNKRAMWMVSDKVRYSMTNTKDAARGTALIGLNQAAWNRVWHLPTSDEKVTAGQLIKQAAEILNVPAKRNVLPKWMLKMAGWFDPTIGELYEMLYQYESDYIFDSSAFQRHFKYQPESYEQGIRETVGKDGN